MCHTFKHLFICNTFCCRLILLSLSLYIELALVCCTNPNNVNCFGTIFPNLNFVWASIWAARPVHIESDQYRSYSTVKQGPAVGAIPSTPIGEQPKTALWLWVREITWYLYTRGVRGRMKAKLECGTWYHHPRRLQCVLSRNQRIFKVATWHYRCCHNLKNNCIWDNLPCCLLVPRPPSKPVMLTFDLQSRKVLFIEIVFWHV